MRRRHFWTILLPLGLIAAPALASQGQRDMGNDCFDVAAPMADATPCYEPSHHTHARHAHHDRAAGQMASKRPDAASDGAQHNAIK
jgi:hypothetical protein